MALFSADAEKSSVVQKTPVSSVYGPVPSWRVGQSLGIDLICENSVCSFNCTYCQLGSIQVRTNERRLFVPTGKVMDDLSRSRWRDADIITFSGSGEPTLALNLGEATRRIADHTEKPTLVLTNGTLWSSEKVRQELNEADQVFLKLDAASEEVLQRVNRPVEGVSLSKIVESAVQFRRGYRGMLGVQMMFVYPNAKEIESFAQILNRIRPHKVQVNTPTRPYPSEWYLASRGSHEGVDYPAKPLKQVVPEQLAEIVQRLRELTGLSITSVHERS